MILWALPALAASLSGTVAAPDGEPLAGIYVAVYDEALLQVGVDGPTGPDGAWRLDDLPAGRLRVRLVPGMAVNRVEGWLPGDTTALCDSQVVEAGPEQRVDGVDAWLDEGVVAEGRILDPDGEPVAGVEVTGSPLVGGSPVQRRQALTRSDGTFSLRGLPPELGWILDLVGEGWPEQVHPGTYDGILATTVVGAPGEVVDIGDATLRPGVRVGGLVTGPDGPLPGVSVTVFGGGQLARATTDEAGRYRVDGLPPGEALAYARADGLALTFHPDRDRPGPRVSLPEDGSIALDVDVALPAEAVIRGTLLGEDLGGTSVLMVNDDGSVSLGAEVLDDGTFRGGRLHGGTWRVRASVASRGYLSGFIGGDEDPVVIEVPEGGATDVELPLERAVEVAGVITDEAGDPVYNALVTVRSRDTGGVWEARTDREGAYRVLGVPGGDTYDVFAEGEPPCPDVDPDRVRIYHPDHPDPIRRVGLAVRPGDRIAWDATLPLDADADGMADAWERRVGLDPTVRDGREDPDGDGLDNLIEYWEDSDPLAEPGGCTSLGLAAVGWGGLAGLIVVARRRRR